MGETVRRRTEYAPVRVYVPGSLVGAPVPELWVVSTVASSPHRDETGGWCPLSAVYARSHLSNGYRAVLDGLVRNRVLEEDRYYRFSPDDDKGPGVCRKFRLAPPYRDEPLVPVAVTDRSLLRRIDRYRRDTRRAVTHPVHVRLMHWHDDVRLTGVPSGEHPLADVMLDGERRFSVCDYGRVHTNVTSLPRAYRRHLSWEGHPSTSTVDVGSSQPLLLSLLVGGKVPDKGDKKGGRRRDHYHTLQEMYQPMLEDTTKGLFYQRIVSETDPPLSRDVVKQETIALLYGKSPNKGPETTTVATAFDRAYPGVLDWCARWPHGELPRLMQRVESEVMIMGAAGDWLKAYSDVPVATIHDALVVPSGYAEAAADVIRGAWRRRWGVEPTLKCA